MSVEFVMYFSICLIHPVCMFLSHVLCWCLSSLENTIFCYHAAWVHGQVGVFLPGAYNNPLAVFSSRIISAHGVAASVGSCPYGTEVAGLFLAQGLAFTTRHKYHQVSLFKTLLSLQELLESFSVPLLA